MGGTVKYWSGGRNLLRLPRLFLFSLLARCSVEVSLICISLSRSLFGLGLLVRSLGGDFLTIYVGEDGEAAA